MLDSNLQNLPKRIQNLSPEARDIYIRKLEEIRKLARNEIKLPCIKKSSLSPISKDYEITSLKSPILRSPSAFPLSFAPSRPISPKFQKKKNPNSVTRLAYKTRVGQSMGKPKAINQDSFIIKPAFLNTRGNYLLSIQDGHGTFGHKVSQFIRDEYPRILEKRLDKKLYSCSIKRGINESIKILSQKLQKSGIEIAYSGSTLVTVLIYSRLLVCSNIGDSRAILAKFEDDSWDCVQLTDDHTLNRKDERERILSSNGRIDYVLDRKGQPVGPERIWLQDEQVPGLAMTRSIGDKISQSIGVISDPEIKTRKLSYCHKFVVIATDGVWEKLTNEEVIKIVSKYWESQEVEDATMDVVNEATKRWGKEDYRDDITAIVAFLAVEED